MNQGREIEKMLGVIEAKLAGMVSCPNCATTFDPSDANPTVDWNAMLEETNKMKEQVVKDSGIQTEKWDQVAGTSCVAQCRPPPTSPMGSVFSITISRPG